MSEQPLQRVFVKTLGCKVNTFDSQALENQFKARGYELLDGPAGADITVINTCSVTAAAEKEARYLLRRYQRDNPAGIRIVTGCYAQIDSGTIASMGEVDFVVPNEVKDRLVGLIEEQIARPEGIKGLSSKLPAEVKAVHDNRQGHFKAALTLFDRPRTERARAFLKIQDGCNGFCAYCQIPLARGKSRSVPRELVLEQLRQLVADGLPEIVLTGIHIGDYGEDLADAAQHPKSRGGPFTALLREILAMSGLKRLRISSLEPSELSRPMLELLAEHAAVVCDHFHLPLQAGSDRILKLMGRQYDTAGYAAAVELIREFFPRASISADVIPGFPSENEADFAATIAFIERCGLSSLHVFPYSKRPNTRAPRLPEHLDPAVIKERASILRQLSHRQWLSYARSFLGETAEILWESRHAENGQLIGKTRNYLDVVALGESSGHLKPFDLSYVHLKGFYGKQAILGLPEPSH